MLRAFQIILSVLALGVALLVHPPEEVASNLSKWAQYVGVKHVPKWLSLHPADRYVYPFSIAFVVVLWVFPYVKKRKAKAFEIIFDRENPGRQFWSLKTIETFSNQISGVEYRVKIRNKTSKTLREVKAETERVGPMGALPTKLIFDQTGETTFALDPGASAFVRLFFAQLPVIQPGTLMGASSAAYGPIKVTVSALDTTAVERVFQFTPLTMQFDPSKESLIF